MRIQLASVAVGLLLARAVCGQEMRAADPVEESFLPAGVSEAFTAIDTSLSGMEQAPDYASFMGDLRTFESELPAVKPQNRLTVLRTMSVSLGGEARQAQDAAGKPAAPLDQGLADLDNAVGNWSDAGGFAQRILRVNPKDPAAWLSLSQADMGSGRAPQALAAAQKSTAFAPKNPSAWRSEALAYAAMGKKSLAASAARRALSLNPADAASKALLQILSEKNPRFHLGKITTGWDNPAAGAFPGSAGSLAAPGPAAAVLVSPKAAPFAAGSGLAAPSPEPTDINGLLRDAADKIAVADYAAALADAARAAEMNPKSPAAYYYQAAADNLRGRYQSAVARATRGLAVDPADVLLRDERAWSFNRLGRVEDAVADSNSALERNPQDPYAYANLSRANEQEGDIRDALTDLGRAAAINPDFAAPYQEALRRYGLLPKKTEQVPPPAPWQNSRDSTFLLVLASSLVGGTLLALGVLGLVRR
ncbi:MAG TPA: tetratricopeptide repeat protein [Elusimicrobiota bacterium]|nr:tetratricopeptide repeat protein [Elusimicrobiota bacterium]